MSKTQPDLSSFIMIETSIPYGEAGGKPLLLDIAYPVATSEMPAPEKMPAVIEVHGGGWAKGERAIDRGLLLVLNGFFYASIDYRLTHEATFPAQIHDVKAAIRWLRAHANQYNVDPDRIGLTGASAGGQLICLAGVTGDLPELEGDSGWAGNSSRVQAVAAINPVTDFRTSSWPLIAGLIDAAFGGPMQDHLDLVKLASPMAYSLTGAPPFLLIHGTADPVVPFSQSEDFYNALVVAGIPATLVAYEGGDHNLFGYAIQNWHYIIPFFKKHLGQPVNYADSSTVSVRHSGPV